MWLSIVLPRLEPQNPIRMSGNHSQIKIGDGSGLDYPRCYASLMEEIKAMAGPENVKNCIDDFDLDQIVERLSWTPLERLQYLLDMLDFEERAHRARDSKTYKPGGSSPSK